MKASNSIRSAGGLRPPHKLKDLETLAWDLGAVVVYGDVPAAFFVPDRALFPDVGPIIGLPKGRSLEKTTFSLAHELGHLVLGHRVRLKPWFIREVEANHWAKQVLRGTHCSLNELVTT